MLKEISVTNLLSYENCSLQLSEGTWNVAGENGSGKSAFLELWLFALYGKIRVASLSDFIRDGQDSGSLAAKFSIGEADFLVTRKLRRNASGNVVSKAELLSSDGSPLAIGDKVTDEITKLLGVSCDVFMLTSFFGMHESEALLAAKPSERLDTLQSVANVDIYNEFSKKARSAYSEAHSTMQTLRGSIDTLDEMAGDKAKGELDSKKKQAAACGLSIERTRSSLAAARIELDKMKVRNNEAKSQLKQLNDLRTREAELEGSVDDVGNLIKRGQVKLDSLRRTQHACKEREKNADMPLDKVEETVESTRDEKKEAEVARQLRELATSGSSDKARCPLCHAKISETTYATWQADIEELTSKLDQLASQLLKLTCERDLLRSNQKELERTGQDTEHAAGLLLMHQQSLVNEERKLRELRTQVKQLALRMKHMQDAVDGFAAAQESVTSLEEELERLQAEHTQLFADVELLKKHQRDSQETRKKLDKAKKAFVAASLDKQAYDILQTLFGRYGIPLTLLAGLQEKLETEATSIYGEFELGGEILVRSIEERGRPGIDIIVRRLSGRERTYAMLSDGQRAVAYFAVRLALSRILSEVYPNVPDFIILDELTAKLSEGNRDKLASYIAQHLKKEYSQILLTSHQTLRNIFDHTIQVTMDNDVTTAKVVE